MLVPNIVWPGFVLSDRGQRQRGGNINLGGTVLTPAHLTITGTLHTPQPPDQAGKSKQKL